MCPPGTSNVALSLCRHDKSATAIYTLEDETEETTFATNIAMELPDTDLVLSVPIKNVTNNQYRDKGKLSLPIGQSTLYVMLNFQNIPDYENIDLETLPVQLQKGFANSVSLLQDESTLVYGTIEDRSEEGDPALVPGESWTLNFYDYYFQDKDFVVSSYSLLSDSPEQYYYFLVPSNNYNSYIYLRPPGLEDEDDYLVDVTIEEQEQTKLAEKIIYPPEQEWSLLIYSKQTTDKTEQINLGAKPLPRKETSKNKKKGSFNFLYWFVVVVLSAWMIYLNLNVFFEYSEVKEEYNKVKEEYEMKKEILNQKVQEYERLKKRLDDYEQDNNQ